MQNSNNHMPYKKKYDLTLNDLQNLLKSEFNNQSSYLLPQNKNILNQKIKNIKSIEKAESFDITFFNGSFHFKDHFLNLPKNTICIINESIFKKYKDFADNHIIPIISENIMHAVTFLIDNIYTENIHKSTEKQTIDSSSNVSNLASIGAGSIIGKNCNIEEFVKIGQNVIIKDNVTIKNNVSIEDGCIIGNKCKIESFCLIKHSAVDDNCHFHPGVKIGIDGFGYTENFKNMKIVKIKQLGSVSIGKNVEIGSNTCIDRGALNDTVIEDNVKIDNLVQIAHNCIIGNSTRICSNAGIAGGVKIGEFNIIGGSVNISNMIQIGNKNMICGSSNITKNVGDDEVIMTTLMHHSSLKKNRQINALIGKIDKIAKSIKKNNESDE